MNLLALLQQGLSSGFELLHPSPSFWIPKSYNNIADSLVASGPNSVSYEKYHIVCAVFKVILSCLY